MSVSVSNAIFIADKKKRLTQACDRCRIMKVKCDATKPACENCHKLKTPCTFLTGNKRRGPRHNIMESLSFLSGSQGNFRHAVLKMDGGKIVELNSSTNARKNQTKVKKEKAKGVLYPNEEPPYKFHSHSAVSSESYRKRVKVKELSIDTIDDQPSIDESPNKKIRSDVVKDVQQLLNIYFEHLHHHIPIVHPRFLIEGSTNTFSRKLLLHSICAITCRYLSNDSSGKSGKPFRDLVQSQLLDCCEEPSVELIQALLIMCFYEFSQADFNKSSLYIGMATRLAQGMGIHKIDEYNQDITQLHPEAWVELETKRRVWWLCFLYDRMVSIESGRPWGIDEDDFCVNLPCEDCFWETQIPVESQVLQLRAEFVVVESSSNRSPASPFSYFLALVVLLGRISKFNSGYEKYPAGDREETFEILSAALAFWENDLPLQFSKKTSMATESNLTMIALMHAFKHTSKILLHLPRLKKHNDQAVKMATMSSIESAKLCFSEARAIIAIAQEVPNASGDQVRPFLDFCVFVAARFFLIGCRCKSPAQSNKSLVCLNLLIKSLKEMSKLWKLADVYSKFLESQLARLNDIPVSTAQPVISAKDHPTIISGNSIINSTYDLLPGKPDAYSSHCTPLLDTSSWLIAPDLTIYSNLVNGMAGYSQCPVLHVEPTHNSSIPIDLETMINMPDDSNQPSSQMLLFADAQLTEYQFMNTSTVASHPMINNASPYHFTLQEQHENDHMGQSALDDFGVELSYTPHAYPRY
ncbi:hypothetical protein K7432_007133 [Basidiobolus ranarum]|uniref:Zn(2)-C6 fungal-type domain-containing protein n=1 Tax=Basidiobolus ranarum TaxID=34480 RepID=A0ABR2WTT7_9FUNG